MFKTQYRFRDTNANVSVVSVWTAATYTPNDFATAQSLGVLISNLSDAQLIGLTLSYSEIVAPGVAGPNSNVNRLYLACCFLGTGDTTLIIIPSADVQFLTTDANGRLLPVIDPLSPIMAQMQGLAVGGVDEYGTTIDSVVLVGLAL